MDSEAEDEEQATTINYPPSPQSISTLAAEDFDIDFDDGLQPLADYVSGQSRRRQKKLCQKKAEHKLAENKVSNCTRALCNKRDKMHPNRNTREEYAARSEERFKSHQSRILRIGSTRVSRRWRKRTKKTTEGRSTRC